MIALHSYWKILWSTRTFFMDVGSYTGPWPFFGSRTRLSGFCSSLIFLLGVVICILLVHLDLCGSLELDFLGAIFCSSWFCLLAAILWLFRAPGPILHGQLTKLYCANDCTMISSFSKLHGSNLNVNPNRGYWCGGAWWVASIQSLFPPFLNHQFLILSASRSITTTRCCAADRHVICEPDPVT